MKTTDIIRRAGRNLKRAKMRTFLTSVAISVGGFAIMASLMVGEGARQYVDRIISSNLDPNALVISKDDSTMSGGSSPYGTLTEYNPDTMMYYGREYNTLNEDDLTKLRQRTDIKNVVPFYQIQPKYIAFSAKADKKYTGDVMMRDNSIRLEVIAGKSIDKGVELGNDEAIIPEAYLDVLGVSANQAVGSTVRIHVEQAPKQVDEAKLAEAVAAGDEASIKDLTETKTLDKEFKIVAVSQKSPDQMTGSQSVYINQTSTKELVDFSTSGTNMYQKYVSIMATAADGKNPDDIKNSLKDLGYSAMTAKDMQTLLFTFVNTLQGIVMGFGALALLVSTFGIVNTMYISVLERTQQIGLMKALGASGRDIGRLFRYEAAWVGFLGGTLGVVTAWAAGTALNPWISSSIGLGEHSLLIFQPVVAVIVVVALMLIAIFAGFLPSRKAAKLDPIEALRTE